ncbi:hypothetical protein [Luteolibacter sp. AS25]|uniref:hypothetical protein n=1 Tax=Luteolibacter sp. AS25 TaxID=3135776 RepID=UPI00398A9FAF
MKPKVVIYQPAEIKAGSYLSKFCEKASRLYNIHLIREKGVKRTFRNDSITIIEADISSLPDIKNVHSVILIGDKTCASSLSEKYAEADQLFWDIANDGSFFVGLIPLLGHNIIQGRFSSSASMKLATAM